MFSSNIKFSLQQKQALNEFQYCMSNWKKYYISQIPHFIPPDNTKYISPQITKRIIFDHEPYWVWNKTNPIFIEAPFYDFKISLVKYTSRSKKNSSRTHPKYKIWLFHITDTVSKEQFSFISVVKGNNLNEKISYNNQIYTFSNFLTKKFGNISTNSITNNVIVKKTNIPTFDDINVSDFSFLKDFVPHTLAKEFGWI